MSSDPNDRHDTPEAQAESGQAVPQEQAASGEEPSASSPEGGGESAASPRKRILIGSQRDPAAYRPKPKRDWLPTHPKRKDADRPAQPAPAVEAKPAEAPPPTPEPPSTPPAPTVVAATPPAPPAAPSEPPPPPTSATPELLDAAPALAPPVEPPPAPPAPPSSPIPIAAAPPTAPALAPDDEVREPRGRPDRRGRRDRDRPEKKPLDLGPAVTRTVERPSVRQKLSDDLEAEFAEALEGVSMDEMLAGAGRVAAEAMLEPESRQAARILTIQRDDVFVELGGREQGIVPLRVFTEPPLPDQALEVIVVRFNPEEGLYELTLPNVAAAVGDWSSISEGMVVEARVTGHNTGGLECEVNHIRGFIPVSQISLYRVENLEEFVEQKFLCVVLEANPQRKNLVLSRRALLEREKEEARQKLLESLAPGQVREGVVRKLMDFGAFVDLGGVDGLLHISQLSWGRLKHPSEALEEGQRIRVRIDRIDRETNRISLAYRDLMESPWTLAGQKYLPNTRARGRVVKLMEFGAFVELEPGVQGLVHISELAHKRVARVGDVLKEGDEIDVMVLSVDAAAQRISLSLKNVTAPPEPETEAESAAPKAEVPPPPPPKPKKPTGPLKGGLGRSGSGDRFGLNW